MSNLNKKAAIKDKRNYQKQPAELKRKGPAMDLREFLLKKMKNNEGEGIITNQQQEKKREEGVIRVSTSGKRKKFGFFCNFLGFLRKKVLFSHLNFIFLGGKLTKINK